MAVFSYNGQRVAKFVDFVFISILVRLKMKPWSVPIVGRSVPASVLCCQSSNVFSPHGRIHSPGEIFRICRGCRQHEYPGGCWLSGASSCSDSQPVDRLSVNTKRGMLTHQCKCLSCGFVIFLQERATPKCELRWEHSTESVHGEDAHEMSNYLPATTMNENEHVSVASPHFKQKGA